MGETTYGGGELVIRTANGFDVPQRREDGYVNATALCKAAGKKLNHYTSNRSTQEFVAELERSAGIPADRLVRINAAGPNDLRGTWVHPEVAIHLAQWCSSKFAVMVSRWVRELLTAGRVEIGPAAVDPAVLARLSAIEAAVRSLVALPPAGGSPGPRYTLRHLLAECGWTTHTRRDRQNIRDMANDWIRRLHGDEIERENGDGNGAYVYTRQQVEVVDRVIKIVRAAAEQRDRNAGPDLYAGC